MALRRGRSLVARAVTPRRPRCRWLEATSADPRPFPTALADEPAPARGGTAKVIAVTEAHAVSAFDWRF
jgi:hypothetical protein